jgi:hypothetical protein
MTTVTPLTDFPDLLSPMVVKELRQGLRTRLFGGVLLVLHALMVLITLMGDASSNGTEVRGLMDGLLVFVLYFIFPLSGFSALAGEMKANTMDMLVLTRLSAGRIVLGKWASIIVQSLLVTVSVVPYIVARYVYGGADLFQDILTLGFQWVVSAVLTAGVVALSTQKQFWLRAIFIAVPLLLSGVSSVGWMLMGTMSGTLASGGTTTTTMGWRYAGWILGAAWLIFALLSFGASRIAPASSMLPVIKRLVNLAALFLMVLMEWLVAGMASVASVLPVVLVVASVDALTDDVRKLPSIYLPFFRRGWWGRLAGLFLAPGWMHGFLYSLLLAGICIALVRGPDAANIWLVACCVWASVFFAQLLAFRRTGEYLSATFAGACMLAFFTMLSFMVQTSSRKEELKWLNCLFPINTMSMAHQGSTAGIHYYDLGLIANGVWPFLLFLLALRAFRQTRPARLEAHQLAKS